MNVKTGFFCVDKPEGMTSHDVVSRMRRILNMKKVGHSGTLDPMATGVLIVGCGPSTRLLDYVQAGVKEYVADIRFGFKTSSGDAQGETVDECDMTDLTLEKLQIAVEKFVGTILQIPPMVSAIKIDGKKLYEYEREGIVVERKPRETTIESIEIMSFEESQNGESPQAKVRVVCHAGTYIRTLAEDIADSLGGYAYLTSLRRTKNGTVDQSQCVSLDQLSSLDDPFEQVIEPANALSHFPSVILEDNQTLAVSHGKELVLYHSQEQSFEASKSDNFVVSGERPRKLIAVFPNDDVKPRKSRCVVFLDD